ncbi:hypothetical protein V8C37DRAFT_143756 [Trichoderma ceciliae]
MPPDMNRNEALRVRGRCSVWDCGEPIFADSLCSEHQLLIHNIGPKAPGPEPVSRSVHRAKRTRRLSLGRTTIGPTQSNHQRSTYSARRSDSTLAYPDNGTEPSSLPRLSSNRETSNHIPEHPASQVPTHPTTSRQNPATTEFLPADASTVMVETTLSEPREPYFALNTDIPSPNQSRSASAHQSHKQDAIESRHVPSNTIPRKHLALFGGLVDVGPEFTSNLNLSAAQSLLLPSSSSSASFKSLPRAISSARTGDASLEESLSITLAKMPSRRKPDLLSTNRLEASTIHVYQKAGQIFQIKENLPLHISPKKRKADSSDIRPRIKEPPIEQRAEGHTTLAESERQTGSRKFKQQEDSYRSALPSKSSKYHGHKLNDEQTASRLRNSKKARASNTLVPAIEVVHAKVKGQFENHTRVQVEVLGDAGGQNTVHTFQWPQQTKPRANGSKDERESLIDAPPSTVEKTLSVVDQTELVATQVTAAEATKAKDHIFDSEAFDTMIYRQSMLRPPRGVSLQVPGRPKTPAQISSVEDRKRYLPINPAIHLPYNRSDEWYKQKTLEIQARGGRKAWFGKVIERRRWLRAKEKAQEDERVTARASNRKTRIDPQPWSYSRIIDFGDVPPEELPEDVLQNPAWVKACTWHRDSQAKRVLRDRAARDAHRKEWDQAERVMEDAKTASKRSQEPLK